MSNNRKSRRRNARLHCEPKSAYPSEYAAMRAGASVGLNWYRCPYCGRWHLTSANTGRRRGRGRGAA